MKRIPPALVLYFMTPAIGELLSGSASPFEFFNPFGLLILPALYGSGAIRVRAIAFHWEKRWPTILVLGLAYGIVEEGLMVISFFDPAWPDLGLLGVYGRWAGVNWVWCLFLTIYHAVFSIAIPIFLVELLFPERRDERWVGRRGMIVLSPLLLAVVLFGFLFLTEYRPPALPYMMAFAATVGLYAVARRMPTHWWTGRIDPRRSPLWFGLVGFASTLVFFIMHWFLPAIGVPVPITLLAVMFLVWTVIIVARRMSGKGGWSDEDKLALVSGALTFFILLAPISELDASRQDNPIGMTLVGLAAFFFLVWLRGKTSRRMRVEELQ
jgi:hypothetical protein